MFIYIQLQNKVVISTQVNELEKRTTVLPRQVNHPLTTTCIGIMKQGGKKNPKKLWNSTRLLILVIASGYQYVSSGYHALLHNSPIAITAIKTLKWQLRNQITFPRPHLPGVSLLRGHVMVCSIELVNTCSYPM